MVSVIFSCREVGETDRDVHRGDDELGKLLEPLGVEGVIIAQEFQQVNAGQIARRVIQTEVLGARITCGDSAGFRVGVPVVDGVVVLDTRIRAFPGGLSHLAEQRLRVDLVHHLAGPPGEQVELTAVLHGPHELIGDAHGVVGVLVLDAGDVLAAEVHVEPGVPEHAYLLFLARLGLDELGHVRVVHVEHHHLRRAPGGAARLDGPGGGVGAAHEGHGTARRAPRGQQFLAGADAGKINARARPALEYETLFPVPFENGVHGVVNGQDKASGCAGGHPGRQRREQNSPR